MTGKLPVVVQTIVYRRRGTQLEVLLLKRSEQRGGFWNAVNGTMETNESLEECRLRELREETGIASVVHWSGQVHKFFFPYKDFIVVVLAYAAEVSPDAVVRINDEHSEHRWVTFEEAATLLKFDDDNKALMNARAEVVGTSPGAGQQS